MSWIDVGHIDDIPVRGARLVKTPVGCVALFRTSATDVFAASDKCPHKGGPLSEGIVHGKSVTCPLHNWVFSLETGQAQGADDGQIPTYPLRVENDRLMLDAEAVSARAAA
ncbi:assimilatory nitrite reductase (NAD(P)H) small subunit [Pacificibacter maritimus]|uniref:Assimilatory nitrite reductase (NAD(P)H) small subunit n=1 Tax=Pacificibacter maritimus TaxID=762213 RepID=A0A3N4U9Q8_9RHOB|nr:nitrite reductase small subunit NirD [Pacificibacter maritimus]RPE66508.1 assimilatory nitrite reductase (NAD(P)H) small subunit [Pacificibacter maritimus]